jgi:hypothetical protein
MQVATTAPQVPRGLLAVGTDMTKVWAVVALHKASLNSTLIDRNMVKAIQLEYLF